MCEQMIVEFASAGDTQERRAGNLHRGYSTPSTLTMTRLRR